MINKRAAGVLLHISSLPSNYGIGTLGKSAFELIDKLSLCKMSYLQVLPIAPTSFGDSPYQAPSAFAGNPYFIDLDILINEGYLQKQDVLNIKWFEDESLVSYELLWENRYKVLKKAYEKMLHIDDENYTQFISKQKYWLDDYSLFMACKKHFNNDCWLNWDEDIKHYKEKAIKKYEKLLIDDINFYKFLQFKFFEQWNALKKYANDKNISIIGDIPIYVSLDSADVWSNSKFFLLDDDLAPTFVAGCPPDAFSEDGQKWGNPLYNWKKLESKNFSWWRKRMSMSSEIYDIIRIDHFIGIERYFSIELEGLAKDGFYTKGPREKLIAAIDESVSNASIIAEDLGVLTPGVVDLLEKSGYPGMKVLQFAFGSDGENPYLPHNHTKNSILYIGTHDNDTLLGYLNTADEQTISYMKDYLDCEDEDKLPQKIINCAFSSVCNTLILQMQDILQKDSSARMNFPSTLENNWQWRMKNNEFDEIHIKYLAKLMKIYNRENKITSTYVN